MPVDTHPYQTPNHSHIVLPFIRLGVNNFRCGLSGDRKVEFILHHRIKIPGDRGVFIIIKAAFGENIGDLLPDAALTGADGAHTIQQFPEVVFTEHGFALFQAIIIQHKAFLDEVFQDFGGPDTEMGGFG